MHSNNNKNNFIYSQSNDYSESYRSSYDDDPELQAALLASMGDQNGATLYKKK
jgi:hypothetical protein